ncbi:Ig-like domain-containing protein [Flavobacteriaceae bacterium]|nr:Ig-like domain-containing protein [Flavobacteriaceae bacterium]
MNSLIRPIFFAFTGMIILAGCAKKGSPTGGPKDSLAPVAKTFFPDNYSVNFKGQRIEIDFDEFIKLKKVKEELLVSPPLNYDPVLSPQTSSKTLKVTFIDTLQEETTYVLHFGNSIVDNNEENVLPQFKYVFSTGSYLDSLSLSGQVRSATNPELDGPVTVMLYPADQMTDSTVYSIKPRYVATARSSDGAFSLTNLKEGQYYVLALKEEQKNYTFQTQTDQIGFIDEPINLPGDSISPLYLFSEEPEFAWTRGAHAGKNRFVFGYNGLRKNRRVTPLFNTDSDFRYTWTESQKIDSLNFWFTPAFDLEAQDTLWFAAETDFGRDSLAIRLKELYPDSLKVNPITRGVFSPKDSIRFSANTPIRQIDLEKIQIIDKDSTIIPAQTRLDSLRNVVTLAIEIKDDNRYQVSFFPEAIQDFFAQTHDTLSYTFKTKPLSDYGTIKLNFSGQTNCPILIELVDTKQNPVAEAWRKESDEASVYFDYIDPDKYRVRITLDCNENELWDTGDYDKKIQPEAVYYLPGLLDIRANWSLNEQYDLTLELSAE